MPTRHVQALAKLAAKADQEYRLTNFDISEVSVVDHPANLVEWLIVKGNNMGTHALQEIIGDGTGDFVAKLTGTTPAPSDAAGSTVPTTPANKSQPPATPPVAPPAALKLAKALRDDTLKSLGVVIKGLITVAQAVDKAEGADDGVATLPDALREVVKSSALALGDLGGMDLEALAKDTNAKSAGDLAMQAELAKTSDALKTLLTSFEKSADPATPVPSTTLGTPEIPAVSPEVASVLAGLVKQVGDQGALIQKMSGRLDIPGAGQPEPPPVHKGQDPTQDIWNFDLPDPNPQQQDTDAYFA